MSRRVASVKTTECHICKKNGETWRVYEGHNFRDNKGRVVCPIFTKKMRENCCHKCNCVGHFADRCRGGTRLLISERNYVNKTKSEVMIQDKNPFMVLEDGSFEENLHPNVTVRKVSKILKSWADWSDSEDEDDVFETPKGKRIIAQPSTPRKSERSPSPFDWDNFQCAKSLFMPLNN